MLKSRQRKPTITRRILAADSLGFDYDIRFSQRKTTAIEIKRENVTVAAPHGSDPGYLQQWVNEKQQWIRDKLEQQGQRRQEVPQPQFCDGASWQYMGSPLTLRIRYRSRQESYIDNQQLWLSVSCSEERCTEQTLQRKLSDWYLSQAQEYMGPKTLRYARQLNKSVSDIKFRRTKSKWGHCTSRGVIQYNWLIMMAPVAVIDYLIAHEVSHLVHHNHSAKFWNTVEKLDPAYRQHRQWLKDQGHKFLI